jgi:hypothetical protein
LLKTSEINIHVPMIFVVKTSFLCYIYAYNTTINSTID